MQVDDSVVKHFFHIIQMWIKTISKMMGFFSMFCMSFKNILYTWNIIMTILMYGNYTKHIFILASRDKAIKLKIESFSVHDCLS